ncbi:MAG: alpha/beta fold hydrolase [Cytophagaceae bacterium]
MNYLQKSYVIIFFLVFTCEFIYAQKIKIYQISGLGADERIYRNLNVDSVDFIFLDWLKPLKKEKIEQYATRMLEKIPEDSAYVMGFSFGGMLAVEMWKQRPGLKLILLSTAKTRKEVGADFHLMGYTGLHKLAPKDFFCKPHSFLVKKFDVKTEEEKALLEDIIRNSDPDVTDWAINCIIYWKNKTIPSDFIHIHGSYDQVIRLSNVNATHVLETGHWLPYDKSEEVGRIVSEYLFSR